MKVLIDTDIAIDFLRGDSSVREVIVSLWTASAAHISILTVYELRAGMREEETQPTMSFIGACTVLPLSVEVVCHAGDYYRHHRRKGLTLTSIDCMIYATAKQHTLKLLTRNVKHYPDKTMILN